MAMNCETFKQNIDGWLDGELSPEMRLEMQEHADACGECASLLEQATNLSQMCAEMNEGLTVPLAAQAAWRQAVRAEARRPKKRTGGWMRVATGVAAAMALLVGGTFGVRSGETVPAVMPTIMVSQDEDYEGLPFAAGERKDGDAVRAGGDLALTGMRLQSDGSTQDSLRMSGDAQDEDAGLIVLRSASRSIRSDSYDSDVQWLNDLVSEYGAYFEERSETAASEDGATGRVSDMVIRTPSDRLDDFLTELDQLGETLVRSEAAEDVTDRYLDTQSRRDALLQQKQKLDDLLEKAESVEELIAVDDKMTDVLASLETLEGDLRRWESRQSYSRVSLTLTEAVKATVQPEASLGERMKSGFGESVGWLQEFGQDALVTLATALPKLVVWIPALALAVIAICAIRRGRRRRD